MTTRTSKRFLTSNNQNALNAQVEDGPRKPQKRPRTAFGDLTNKENVVVPDKKKICTTAKLTLKTTNNAKKTKPVLVSKPARVSAAVTIASSICDVNRAVTSSQEETTTSQQERILMMDEVLQQTEEILREYDSTSASSSQQSSQSNASEASHSPSSEVAVMEEKVQSQPTMTLTKSVMSVQPCDPVDVDDLGDPLQVALYASDIFRYYSEREVKFQLLDDYMSWQHDVSGQMRAILVDWLVEVQENFELNHETLYLAVKFIDQYLSREQTPKQQLQLIGATAMFVAGKYEERYPPAADDYIYICDQAYTRKQLITMETRLLRTLDFELGIPVSYRFLRRFAKCGRVDSNTRTLARYILEMSLLDYKMCQHRESKLAAAALYMALAMKGMTWCEDLERHSGYSAEELRPLSQRLNRQIARRANSSSLRTIRTKYSHPVFEEVAKIPLLPITPSPASSPARTPPSSS